MSRPGSRRSTRLRSPARRDVVRALVAVPAVLVAAALGGCSDPAPAAAGATSASPAVTDPVALLDTARRTLDATPGLAFRLDGKDLPPTGTAIVAGSGELARPDGFQGVLDVRLGDALSQVEVVSTGGTFYAKLPFTTGFSKVDPHALGFTDPGSFMNPRTGISQLLSQAKDPVLGGEVRAAGDVAREVRATLPGTLVDQLLLSADPATDVDATFAVTPAGELRRAVLVGPFYAKGTRSTFTIVLRDYGKRVEITPPA